MVIALRGQLVGSPYFVDRRESYSYSTSSALRSTYVDKRTSSDSTRSGLLSSRVVEYMQSNKSMMISSKTYSLRRSYCTHAQPHTHFQLTPALYVASSELFARRRLLLEG